MSKFKKGELVEYVGFDQEFYICKHERTSKYSFVSRIPLFHECRFIKYTNKKDDPYECVVQLTLPNEQHSHLVTLSDNNLITVHKQYPCSESWKNSNWGWDEHTGKFY